MKLNDLISAIQKISRTGEGNPVITSIVHDSRETSPGCLFVAIPGFKSDGFKFIEEAIKRGAAAVVSEQPNTLSTLLPFIQVISTRKALAELSWEFFGHPERHMKMIAVTGTNGKTTIATVLANLLTQCGIPCGSCGTLGTQFLNQISPSPRTTPEADHLAPLLRQMSDAHAECCVMEATSIGIVLNRVHGINFDLAIFSNLTRDHLDFHGSWDAYLDAKLTLFRNL